MLMKCENLKIRSIHMNVHTGKYVHVCCRYKYLQNGQALFGDKLMEELKQLAQSYIVRADRLLNIRST